MIKTINTLGAYIRNERHRFAPSVLALTCAFAVGYPPAATSETTIDTFPSPYMNAKDTPLVELENGARVGQDTADYWNLPLDSPQRASYDKDIVVEVAEGVWTIGTSSLVNIHAVEGPDGLIVYDTGDNIEEGAHFYGLLRSVTQAPIRAIIYSHEHYVKGAKAFVDEEEKRGNTDIQIIGHPNTNDSMARTGGLVAMYPEVTSILLARTVEQFNSYLPTEQGGIILFVLKNELLITKWYKRFLNFHDM